MGYCGVVVGVWDSCMAYCGVVVGVWDSYVGGCGVVVGTDTPIWVTTVW